MALNHRAFAPNAWQGDNLVGWHPQESLDHQITGVKAMHRSYASEAPQEKCSGDRAKMLWHQRTQEAVHHRMKQEHEAIRKKTVDSRYKKVRGDQPTNTTDIIESNYHRGMRS